MSLCEVSPATHEKQYIEFMLLNNFNTASTVKKHVYKKEQLLTLWFFNTNRIPNPIQLKYVIVYHIITQSQKYKYQ